MARKFTVSIDLNKNELLNARLQNLSSDPSSPVAGQIYYNTTAGEQRFYDGNQWIAGGATKYGLEANRPSASKSGTLYAATDTHTLYLDNGSSWIQISVNPQDLIDAIDDHNNTTINVHGIANTAELETQTGAQAKADNALDSAVAYTDTHELKTTGIHGVTGNLVGTSDSQTLTNKTLGSGNSLGDNLDADGYTIINLPNPSSSGDAANKAYVDSQIGGAELTFYGTTDEVEVSKVGNDVTIGLPDDVTIAGEITAASGHITGNLQIDGDVNIDGTLNAINRTEVNIDDNTIVLNSNFTGTPTADAGIKVERGDSADVSLIWNETDDQWTLTNDGSNYHSIARKFATNIGDGVATSYTVTHNLGTKDVTVQIFENSADYNQIEADVQHTSTSVVTVKFAVAPTSNEYRVVVVG